MKKQISSVLREERNKKEFTAANVADKLLALGIKVSPKTIYNWETGHSQPTPDILMALCSIYQIDDVLETFGYGNEDSSNLDNLKDDEIGLIKKYRPLDAHGKEAVTAVLDIEHERFKRLNQNKVAIVPVEIVYDDDDYEDEDDIEELPVAYQPASAGSGEYLDDDCFEMMSFPASEIPYGAKFGIRIAGDSMEPTIKDGQIVFVKPTSELYDGEIGIFMQDGDCFCKRLEIDYDERITYLVSDNDTYPRRKVTEDCRTIGRVLLKR